MPYRSVHTRIWRDAWFEKLNADSKYFFLYLITNPGSAQAGLYELTPRRMAFDTSLETPLFEELVASLEPRVMYHLGWIWVKDYLKYQTPRPRLLIAAFRQARLAPDVLFQAWLEHNVSILAPIRTHIEARGGAHHNRQSQQAS